MQNRFITIVSIIISMNSLPLLASANTAKQVRKHTLGRKIKAWSIKQARQFPQLKSLLRLRLSAKNICHRMDALTQDSYQKLGDRSVDQFRAVFSLGAKTEKKIKKISDLSSFFRLPVFAGPALRHLQQADTRKWTWGGNLLKAASTMIEQQLPYEKRHEALSQAQISKLSSAINTLSVVNGMSLNSVKKLVSSKRFSIANNLAEGYCKLSFQTNDDLNANLPKLKTIIDRQIGNALIGFMDPKAAKKELASASSQITKALTKVEKVIKITPQGAVKALVQRDPNDPMDNNPHFRNATLERVNSALPYLTQQRENFVDLQKIAQKIYH